MAVQIRHNVIYSVLEEMGLLYRCVWPAVVPRTSVHSPVLYVTCSTTVLVLPYSCIFVLNFMLYCVVCASHRAKCILFTSLQTR